MSRYTKQHYEDVARLIRESWPEAMPEDVNEVILFSLANKFADLFAADNPDRPAYEYKGFDRERFLAACGLEPETSTCPLCGKPSPDGWVHKDCADYEQGYSDYVAAKTAGELDE